MPKMDPIKGLASYPISINGRFIWRYLLTTNPYMLHIGSRQPARGIIGKGCSWVHTPKTTSLHNYLVKE